MCGGTVSLCVGAGKFGSDGDARSVHPDPRAVAQAWILGVVDKTAHHGEPPAARREIDGRDFDLHSVVVSYEHRADRCTIYPRERSHYERLETWLSADEDAFVSLCEMR